MMYSADSLMQLQEASTASFVAAEAAAAAATGFAVEAVAAEPAIGIALVAALGMIAEIAGNFVDRHKAALLVGKIAGFEPVGGIALAMIVRVLGSDTRLAAAAVGEVDKVSDRKILVEVAAVEEVGKAPGQRIRLEAAGNSVDMGFHCCKKRTPGEGPETLEVETVRLAPVLVDHTAELVIADLESIGFLGAVAVEREIEHRIAGPEVLHILAGHKHLVSEPQ